MVGTLMSEHQCLVVHADARDYVRSIESETYDLAILDPNYQDWKMLCESGFFDEVMRIMKPTGNVICFTKQPFDHLLRTHVDKWFRREFVWTFTNGGAWVSSKMPLVSYQKIYWLVKSDGFYFNSRTGLPYHEHTKSFKRSQKIFGDWEQEGRQFQKSDEGLWMRDHYHFNKPNTGAIPSKPSELMRILVHCFSPPNGLVIDPFYGSGTTGLVCKDLDRTVLGIEIMAERARQF